MAVADEKIPYEILIRFGADGVPLGAHVQYRRRVTIDGEVVKDDPMPAEALAMGGDFPTSAVMNDALARALAGIADRAAELAAVKAALAERDAAIEAMAKDAAAAR
jgi:hypothetical protein